MRETRFILITIVVLLSLVLVGVALADSRSGASSNPEEPLGRENPPIETQPGLQSVDGIESIGGSIVTFDPSVGGDDFYHPGLNQTFCFRADSYTDDWEWVDMLWQRFPDDWSINDVYVEGTPTCDMGGAFDLFTWGYVDGSLNEIRIDHHRTQGNPIDHCTAYYCFETLTGTSSTEEAQVSWYWEGDMWGGTPHFICSSDNYTPDGESACEEAVNPPAAIAAITTEKLPVILIPGMGASANYECFLGELFCGIDSRWGWFTLIAESLYSPLIDRMEAAGYTTDNNYLNVLYYDWRKPIEANVPRLKERIDSIKEITGKDQVNLIGHSMGGLLARTYVQGDIFDKEDDVAHVVTLGSPHLGAAKAYPYWQAGYVYEMGTIETYGTNLWLQYYMKLANNPVKVFVLRDKFPSFRDILPIFEYIRDNETGNDILESTLQHRNTYLRDLAENNSVLFERADVATFVGEDIETTKRFYVDEPSLEDTNLYQWDDGKPNWNCQLELCSDDGDGTVLSESGKLTDGAFVRDFPGVDHVGLTGNNDVINAVFSYLGITVAPDPAPSTIPEILIFIVDGIVEAIVTDPLGRILQPTTYQVNLNNKNIQGDPIPNAEYIHVPGNPFQIILIPNPLSGDYQIQVDGLGEGDFTLGRLDTVSDPLDVPVPAESFWDLSNSQIQVGKTVNYTLNYSALSNEIGNLKALTPLIETPVWVGASKVSGRGLPGSTIIIKDFNSNVVLGSGVVNADGLFNITLITALNIRQQIFPVSNSLTGSVVTVKSHDVFLPLSLR